MMKKWTFLFAVLVLVVSGLYSQNPWEFIDPIPTGNTLNSVCFTNSQTGFAVGNYGTILKTTNAGKNWVVDNSFKGDGLEYQRFKDVAFINQNDGYISGYKLLKTNNGGDTWETIPTGDLTPPNAYLYSYKACFLNNLDTGFVTGINPTTSNYELRKTTDGGSTWITKLFLTSDVTSIQQIFFSDTTNGWLVCAEKIYKTTDAGENWTEVIPNPSSAYYVKIYFTDNNTGYLLSGDFMIKTTDGGLTWSYLPTVCTPGEICFTNDSTGYIAGGVTDGDPVIQKTTDTGQTWTTVFTGSGMQGYFISMNFTDQHTGYAVGFSGQMIKFTDTDGNFNVESLNKTGNFIGQGKFFNDKIYVYSLGEYKYSDNHGVSWTAQVIDSSPDFGLRSMFFVNDSTGFAVSYDAMISTKSKIYKTTDGGNTWNVRYFTDAGYCFNDIYFVNETVGYAVGSRMEGTPPYQTYYGIVYKTTDGGETWAVANNLVGKALYSLYFTSADIGYVCGMSSLLNKAVIGKTTNGGVTWTLTNITTSPYTIYLAKILFTSNSTGYASGYRGAIFKTTNSGVTWTKQTTGETNIMGNICALNSDTVYVSANMAYLRTINGGATWTKEVFKQEMYGTPSIHFYNDTTGIAIGASSLAGVCLRTGHFLPTSKLSVLGAGEYCFGSMGLPVYMPQTEYNVNYTLYKNGLPQTTLLASTDSLSFGNQLAGTYTVQAANQYGSTVMQDTVVITENQIPAQPGPITGSATPLPGSSQNYSVINVAGVTYTWAFPEGWLQTGGGTTNSVTVTVGSSSGNIMVTPSTVCGEGLPQTLAVVPAAPTAYAVTGGGSYCYHGGGLPVDVANSEYGVTYTLYKDAVAQVPTVEGKGEPITFGNQTAGTYTVSGTNAVGTTPMTGNAVIIETPTLVVSVTIAADINHVPAGTAVTLTAIPVNGGTTPFYQWTVNEINIGTDSAVFTYIPVNNDVLTCALTSNETCTTGNPAISNQVTITVISNIINLQNIVVVDGETNCYNAIQTIYVAEGGTTFTVQNGGSATMIAGQNIVYFPGTKVDSGGYMLGTITTTGQYCNPAAAPLVAVKMAEEVAPVATAQSFFRVYPNPTTGTFTLEINGESETGMTKVEIFSMRGDQVLNSEISVNGKHELSLSGKPVGIYVIRMITGNKVETARIIKQ